MGELADAWSAAGRTNLWGAVPQVIEMQSEGGAAGALHGALQAGALCTTFTASQGLLLMIPNMYKIAGELTPAVIHVAARTLATHALSIFGDHSDVMAVRQTGWAMLASSDVQAAQDLAAIAHAATLESSRAVPPLLRRLPDLARGERDRRARRRRFATLVDDRLVRAHRERALSPDHPVLRGTAQNPDVFFQAREAVEPLLRDRPAGRAADDGPVRRAHRPRLPPVRLPRGPRRRARRRADGLGLRAPRARPSTRSSRAERRSASLNVRLFRPVRADAFVGALPSTVRAIAVLDRTKEPGAPGEPLYQDVVTALAERVAARRRPDDADGHRRTVRPRLEGVRPGDGQGGVRRAREATRRSITSPSASSTTSRTPRSRSTASFTTERRRRRASRVLRARRRRHGERQQELGQDHRRGDRPVRAGLLRLRLEEVGLDDDLAPAVRPAPDPLDVPDRLGPGELRRLPPVRLPRARSTCSTSPRPARRSC